MFITKMSLPRRTFLRGMGVTLALPLLDAMVPAASALAKTAAKPVRRLGFVYVPNGCVMPSWQPAYASGVSEGPMGSSTLAELPRTLSPLEPFKNQVILPIGLSQKQAEALGDGNGEHSRAGTVWLSGVHPKETEGADVRNGTTADQIAAQHIGGDTPLTSLELAMEQTYLIGNCDNGYSCVYTNSISWRTDTTPNPHETNPRIVFQRLFGDGGTPEERLAQLQEDRSILDWVTADITHLQKKLGAADRNSVSEYLDSVREIERRIQVTERQHGESTLELPDRPVGVPESYDEHAKLMFDLLAVAFKADITRVFVFTLGKEQTNRAYPELGVNAAHHAVSHHQHSPVKYEQGTKVNQYHLGLTAHFLDQLKSTPEGDGNLLDHSLVLHGGGISDANEHSHINLPLVLIGGAGGVKGGRILRHTHDTPMNNLLMAMLERVGVNTDEFGDATGVLPFAHRPLSGVLRKRERPALAYKQLWMVEAIFRSMKSVLETRPIYHRTDRAIRGHVFCSFLALVLRQELTRRLADHGWSLEWADIVRALDHLTETTITVDAKDYVIRSEMKGTLGKVFQAAGVAIPPALRPA